MLITVFGSTGRLGGINCLAGCELNTLGDGVTSIIASLRFNPIAANAVVGTIFDYDQPPSAINHVRRLAVTRDPVAQPASGQQCVNIPWPGFCVATPVKEPTPLVTRMRADVPTNVTRLATMSNPSVPGAADTIDGGGNYPTASRPLCVTNCGGTRGPVTKKTILNFLAGMAGHHVIIGQSENPLGTLKYRNTFTSLTGKHVAILGDVIRPDPQVIPPQILARSTRISSRNGTPVGWSILNEFFPSRTAAVGLGKNSFGWTRPPAFHCAMKFALTGRGFAGNYLGIRANNRPQGSRRACR